MAEAPKPAPSAPNAPSSVPSQNPPAITNKTVEDMQSSRRFQAGQEVDPWEGVTAAPLYAPAIDQIKKLNPDIEIRWVNRAVATSATPTRRFEECQAMGWVIATPQDVVPPPGTLKDGVIQAYDVILMKIDRRKYLGDLKWKNQRVNQAVSRQGIANAQQELRDAFSKEGVLKQARGKVEAFIPGTKELEKFK